MASGQDGGLSGAPFADAGLSGGMVQSGGSGGSGTVTSVGVGGDGGLTLSGTPTVNPVVLLPLAADGGGPGTISAADYVNFLSAFTFTSQLQNDQIQVAKAFAISLLASQTARIFVDDFVWGSSGVPVGWTSDFFNGTGQMFNSASTEESGIIFQQSSATVSSRYNLYLKNQLFDGGGTKPWVLTWRGQLSAVGANTVLGFGLVGTDGVGSIGLASINGNANYLLQYGSDLRIGAGTQVSTTVATDTAYHIWTLFMSGSTVKVYQDYSLKLTQAGVAGGFTAKCGLNLICQNGAAGGNRTLESSWLVGASMP